MNFQAVFIDRDGTLGGDGHFNHPDNFVLYSFSLEAINILKTAGLKLFIFTNQHRISRGDATLEDFINEFEKLGFDAAYICPHEMNSNCECQKPKPGMLLQAAKEYDLDLSKCVVIGDVGTDMIAANSVGAIKILVKTGWGKGSLSDYRHTWSNVDPDYIAEDLLDAANWIIEKINL